MVEADGWLYEMRHQDEFGDGIDAEDITVDEWVKFWHTELIKHLAANTRGNYAERYYQNIQPVIGRMKLKNVKPMHCTKEEQRKFLDVARRSRNYYQYAFLLETGLRTGDLIALTRDNVDRERRTLTIRKTMEFRYKRQDQKQKKSFKAVLYARPSPHLCHPGHRKRVGSRKRTVMWRRSL